MSHEAISSLSMSVGHDKKSSYVDHSLLSAASSQAPTVAYAGPSIGNILNGSASGQSQSASAFMG